MNLTTINTATSNGISRGHGDGIFESPLGGISQSTHRDQPTGIRLVPGELCQYGDIDADCVLRVDFDQTVVAMAGLYLVEAVTADGVAWMGCRRFDRGLSGLRVDDTGAGDWRDAGAASGLRVVGRVLKVYRSE